MHSTAATATGCEADVAVFRGPRQWSIVHRYDERDLPSKNSIHVPVVILSADSVVLSNDASIGGWSRSGHVVSPAVVAFPVSRVPGRQ